jgi:hypothetical protein
MHRKVAQLKTTNYGRSMSIEQNIFNLFKFDENANFKEPVFKSFLGSVHLFQVMSEIYSDIEREDLTEARAKINYLGALFLSNHEEKAREICVSILGEDVTNSFEELLKVAALNDNYSVQLEFSFNLIEHGEVSN